MILGDLFESRMKRVMDTVQDFVQLTDKEFTARHGISPVSWVKQNQSLLSSIADQYPAIKKYIPAPDAHLFQEDAMVENLRKWFREKWVRFGPDGKIRGSCARGSKSEGKPKCLPQAKAHALGKKGRASAAAKKRREDPNPERRGPARNVATKVREQGEGFLGDREYNRVMPFVKRIAGEVSDYDRDEFGEELWSLLDQKYGSKFAQSVLDDLDIYWDTYTELTGQQGVAETFIRPETAHEQQVQLLSKIYAELYWGDRSITERARTARTIFDAVMNNELDVATLKMEIRALEREQEQGVDEGIFGFSEEQLDEKQDACYHKVKARYKVWPSAYASGALVQCRKKGAANWGKGSKKK